MAITLVSGTLPFPCTGREGGREAGGQITRRIVRNQCPSIRVTRIPPSSPPSFSTCLSSLPLQRVSPSAEMVMIDRMFIQEEKTTLALDKQLAKEKPGERGGGERGTKGVPRS